MTAPPPSSLSPKQKGTVAELAHDVLVTLRSRGRLRLARVEADDGGVDRLVYAPQDTDRVLFVNPKGARALQRGRFFEFRVPLWKIPRGGAGYFVALCPLIDEAPWIGSSTWLIPGGELLRGADPAREKVIRVPVEPDPSNAWEQFRRPRETIAAGYSAALGVPLTGTRNRRGVEISETAQAFVLESALICHLIVGGGGVLRAWAPVVDDEGLDCAVKFAGAPLVVGLQPKGAFHRDIEGLLQVHVPAATFYPSPSNFLVILEFDPEALALGEFMWFIPTEVIADRVARSGGVLVFRVSPDRRSTKDNFLPWRYPTAQFPEVVATALAVLSRDGPGAKLPSNRGEIAQAQERLLRPAERALRAGGSSKVAALRRAAISGRARRISRGPQPRQARRH